MKKKKTFNCIAPQRTQRAFNIWKQFFNDKTLLGAVH